MPLIKARHADSQFAQAEVLRLQDVEAEAERILAAARQKADAMLADARSQAERLRTEAHQAGLAAGQAEGLKAGQGLGCKQAHDQAYSEFAARHATLVRSLTKAFTQFEASRSELLSAMERDVIALAGAIAHRVTKAAVEVDPACVAGNVREALQLLASRNRLEVRLHPADLDEARRVARDLLAGREFQAIEFAADEAVCRGGALLVTPGGQIDATIETQWRRVLDEILAAWRQHWLLTPAVMTPLAPQPQTGAGGGDSASGAGGALDGAEAAVESADDFDDEACFFEITQAESPPAGDAVDDDPAAVFAEDGPDQDESVPGMVEIVQPADGEPDADNLQQALENPADQQALIEEALAQATRAMARGHEDKRPAVAFDDRDAAAAGDDATDGEATVEEIPLDQVEEIDPDDVA